MSTVAELMAGGLPSMAASQIGNTASTGVAAAGTTKATATVLAASALVIIATCPSNAGVILPPASGSAPIPMFNGGANSCKVYANGTDVINASSAGAAFTVTNAKGALFTPAGNRWVGNLSA